MTKKLISDQRFCSGCMACVVNCSQFREGHAAPASSRIHIDHDPFSGAYICHYCTQCEEKACARECPVQAISESEGCYLKINYELCTGCQSCIAACPSAAIFYDSVTSKVIKCDTCDGDPECAKVCYTRALLWVETENIDKFEREKLQSRYFTREKVGPKKMD
jgi:anaerobic carbon-monoxide dehydrogenase iron sulfur subunit